MEVKPIVLAAMQTAGITRCEDCGTTLFLTLAHRKKRRYCDRVELHLCALLCQSDHQRYEDMGHERMFNEINAIIERRPTPLKFT